MGVPPKAKKLIQDLINAGMSTTQIAAGLDLHVNSVDRWHKGTAKPHNGNLARLRALHAQKHPPSPPSQPKRKAS